MTRDGFVAQQEADDCYRAAVATVLGLSLKDVPHFFREVGATSADRQGKFPAVYERVRDWARRRSLAPLFIPVTTSLAFLLEKYQELNPGVPYILGGTSGAGTGHAVVVHGGRIVHDPARPAGPEAGSIVGPSPDGQYEVTYFVALPPWARASNADGETP